MKTNLRLWVIGSVAAMAALLVGGFLVGVQPLLTAASTASDSAAQVSSANQSTQIRLASLAKQAGQMDALKAQETDAAAAVPATLAANAFVDRINALATSFGVKVESVTPGTAQAYSPPASVQAAQQAAAAAAVAAATPSAGPSPSPAAPGPAAAAVPVLAATDMSITGANFTVVPMAVAVKGSLEGTLQFVHAVQHDKRLFLVSGYEMSSDGQSAGKVLATLNGYIYALKH